MNKKYGITILAAWATLTMQAQAPVVQAAIDSTTLWIGDQANLTLEATMQPEQTVAFPTYAEQIIEGVEVVGLPTYDTTQVDGGRVRVCQHYKITSFTDSLYYLPPFPFVLGQDTFYSQSLSLNVVQPFEIDTTQNAITDIKGVYQPPFDWRSLFHWKLLLAIALLAAAVLLVYYIRKRMKNKTAQPTPTPVPTRPAYEVAIEQLDQIKGEKLWQQSGRQKEYHTQLTTVVRTYIDGTFGIGCMEMPSSEVLDDLQISLHNKRDAYAALKQLFGMADLVKFAKWTPTPDENEACLRNAYLFVNDTKPAEDTAAEQPQIKNKQ